MSESNKRCILIGGSGQLGQAVAKILAEENCQAVLTYHKRPEPAQKLAAEFPGLYALPCDLRDFAGVRKTLNEAEKILGGVDCLILAAGVSGDAKFFQKQSDEEFHRLKEVDQAELDQVLSVNTRGGFAACQAAHPLLSRSGGGNIVIVGALDGIKTVPSPIHFAAGKAFLKGLTESLSKELGPEGIRVNLVAPGILESGQADKLSEKLKEPYLKYSSLGRFGQMSEIADVICWFALKNTYITGQSILLDGGL